MQTSLFRSLLSNWVGLALAVLIGICISPFVVRSLGHELYGVWTLALAVSSQLIVFEFGIRSAVVKFLSEYKRNASFAQAASLLWTSQVLLLILACLALLTLFIFSPEISHALNISPQYHSIFRIALLIAGIDAALEIALGVSDAGLAASERYDLLNLCNVTRLIINALVLVLVLSAGYGVIGVALTQTTTRLIQRSVQLYLVKRVNPWLAINQLRFTKELTPKILKYGAASFLIVLALRVINQIDNLVVGSFLGLASVTLYAVPLILIEQLRMFAQTSNTILTPRLSSIYAQTDPSSALKSRNEATNLLLRFSRYNLLLAFAIGTPLIITGADFMRLWMGDGFQASYLVLVILALQFYLVLPAAVFVQQLYATGLHARYAKLAIFEALLNISLSLLLVREFGLTGVAVGTLIPAVLVRGLLLPFISVKVSDLSITSYYRGVFVKLLPLGALHLGLLYALQITLGSSTWGRFLALNTIGLITLLICTFLYYLDDHERAYLLRRLKRV